MLRRSLLIVHVLSSVGWFGAVAAFLALAITGLGSGDDQLVSTMYLAAQLITWCIIVPFGALSFLSGVLQALGTHWGLVRHYWVLMKLVLTTGALGLLILHTSVVDAAAGHAAGGGADGLDAMRLQLVIDSAAACAVLALTTLLSVVKPRGRTPFRENR
ncbi:hypothetical protein BJY17_000802 [Agromyces hippuratus]|uniref:DUF2269 domain-containing protein n=1 Tax=Agromyces hippuratus TaxID=286438 RepID=A0A852X1R4_9MICO|nr:DUF2269 domain-containing protein [Agromyces hippuratus]NYG20055.1 hypothetical protein [Agromyces hippuratus]